MNQENPGEKQQAFAPTLANCSSLGEQNQPASISKRIIEGIPVSS